LSIQSPNQTLANEDCLFLNVQVPANASGPLPVLVWIHGGGYGAGNGRQDFAAIINDNNDSFVGVSIQYRLGAFGFLASDEVYRNGVVNAGLLDQHFALQWIQSYVSLFGGNASQVTISGESAGGGSVMLQDIAYGGDPWRFSVRQQHRRIALPPHAVRLQGLDSVPILLCLRY
jgi:carboxylesterase type B